MDREEKLGNILMHWAKEGSFRFYKPEDNYYCVTNGYVMYRFGPGQAWDIREKFNSYKSTRNMPKLEEIEDSDKDLFTYDKSRDEWDIEKGAENYHPDLLLPNIKLNVNLHASTGFDGAYLQPTKYMVDYGPGDDELGRILIARDVDGHPAWVSVVKEEFWDLPGDVSLVRQARPDGPLVVMEGDEWYMIVMIVSADNQIREISNIMEEVSY